MSPRDTLLHQVNLQRVPLPVIPAVDHATASPQKSSQRGRSVVIAGTICISYDVLTKGSHQGMFDCLIFPFSASSSPLLFCSSALCFVPLPLLCGPSEIIPYALCFTIMSPHLCLIVLPSRFQTQGTLNTFFLLAPNLIPPSSLGWLIFHPSTFLICINIFSVSHFSWM